jgi:Protein of unknown function (DUF1583)
MVGHRAKYACMVACAFLMALELSWSPTWAQPAYPKEIYQDFRDKKPLRDELEMVGPGRDQATKSEVEGLRITLPTTKKWFDPTGVRLNLDLAGDFEITGAYELLSVDKPKGGGGAGVAFNVVVNNKFSRFGRFVLPEKGGVYLAECRLKDRPDEDRYTTVPTEARTGQLRVIRTGSKLHFLVADGPANVFREIQQAEFSAEAVEGVRFQAANNGSMAGTDIRLIDWKIRYGAAGPPAQAAAPVEKQAAAPAEKQAERPSRGWLMAFLLIAASFVFLIAIALAAAFFLLKRRSAGAPPDAKH